MAVSSIGSLIGYTSDGKQIRAKKDDPNIVENPDGTITRTITHDDSSNVYTPKIPEVKYAKPRTTSRSGGSNVSSTTGTGTMESATPKLNKPSAGGGSVDYFSKVNLQKMLDAYNGDKRALYSTVLNKAKNKGLDGKTILGQLNRAFIDYEKKPIEEDIIPPQEIEAQTPEAPDTGIESVDEVVDLIEQIKQSNNNQLQDIREQREKLIDDSKALGIESFENQQKILDERMQNTEKTFDEVFDTINELKDYANKLFDINVVKAIQARGAQLVEKGILSSEQAAGATGGIMTLYKQSAEAKRADILVKVQDAMKSALIEKNNAVDAILADKGATEANKGLMLERVNKYYDDVIGAYQNDWVAFTQTYDNLMMNALNQKINIDVAQKIAEVENEVAENFADERIQKANTDADSRMDYIMSQVQATDPALNKYVATLLKEYMDAGTFMTTPLTKLVADVLKRSAQMMLGDMGSTAVGGGGSGGGSRTTVGTETQNVNTNTNESPESNLDAAVNKLLGITGGNEVGDTTQMSQDTGTASPSQQTQQLPGAGATSPVTTAETIPQESDIITQMNNIISQAESTMKPATTMEIDRSRNIQATIRNIDARINSLTQEIQDAQREIDLGNWSAGASYPRILKSEIASKQNMIRELQEDAQQLLSTLASDFNT